MAQNFDLENTGQEVQSRINQVPENTSDIAAEVQARINGDAAVTTECKGYTDTETTRAENVESSLQTQIDAIVAGGATVSLSVSPTVVEANDGEKLITLTASTNSTATAIRVYRVEGETRTQIGDDGSGSSHTVTDTLTPESAGTVQYVAELVIAGNVRTTNVKTVTATYPIFVGVGATHDAAVFTELSIRTTPAGATFEKTTASGDHIFVEVPQGMTVNHLYLVGLIDTELGIETVTTERTDAEGRLYTAYKNIEPRGEGTYTYKLA